MVGMANQNNNLKMIIDSTAPQPYLPGPLISIIITELNNQQKSYFLIFYGFEFYQTINEMSAGGIMILKNYLTVENFYFHIGQIN